MRMTTDRVRNAPGRAAAEAFLAEHIPSDSQRFSIEPEERERMAGWRPSVVLVTKDRRKDIVAVAHLGLPYADVLSDTMALGLPVGPEEVTTMTAWMLHGIAVAPSVRGQGVGVALLRQAEDLARAAGGTEVIGVGDDNNIGFYRTLGYLTSTVHAVLAVPGRDGRLRNVLSPLKQGLGLHWFCKPLDGPRTVWLQEELAT